MNNIKLKMTTNWIVSIVLVTALAGNLQGMLKPLFRPLAGRIAHSVNSVFGPSFGSGLGVLGATSLLSKKEANVMQKSCSFDPGAFFMGRWFGRILWPVKCTIKELGPTPNKLAHGFSDQVEQRVPVFSSTLLHNEGTQKKEYCEIYLIRHGELDWSVAEKLQGTTDIPLNEQGEKQAVEIKGKLDHLTFSTVFSSDLKRAHRTAQIIIGTKNIPLIQTSALRGRHLGKWEGSRISEFKQWLKQHGPKNNFSQQSYITHKWDEGMENYAEVYARITDFIKTSASDHMGSKILFSTHGTVLRAFLYSLDFRPGYYWHISNCALIKLRANKNGEISLIDHEGTNLTHEALEG